MNKTQKKCYRLPVTNEAKTQQLLIIDCQITVKLKKKEY